MRRVASYTLWPNGLMDEDATWYGSRHRRRPHCIRRVLSAPRQGHSNPPLLGPCLLWPRSPISATAELLLYSLISDQIHSFGAMGPKNFGKKARTVDTYKLVYYLRKRSHYRPAREMYPSQSLEVEISHRTRP